MTPLKSVPPLSCLQPRPERPSGGAGPDAPERTPDTRAPVFHHTDAPSPHPRAPVRPASDGPRARGSACRCLVTTTNGINKAACRARQRRGCTTRLRELEAVHRPAAPPLLTGLFDPRHPSSPLESWRPERALATSVCWPPRVRFDTSRPRRLMLRAVRRVVHHRRLSLGWQVRVVQHYRQHTTTHRCRPWAPLAARGPTTPSSTHMLVNLRAHMDTRAVRSGAFVSVSPFFFFLFFLLARCFVIFLFCFNLFLHLIFIKLSAPPLFRSSRFTLFISIYLDSPFIPPPIGRDFDS